MLVSQQIQEKSVFIPLWPCTWSWQFKQRKGQTLLGLFSLSVLPINPRGRRSLLFMGPDAAITFRICLYACFLVNETLQLICVLIHPPPSSCLNCLLGLRGRLWALEFSPQGVFVILVWGSGRQVDPGVSWWANLLNGSSVKKGKRPLPPKTRRRATAEGHFEVGLWSP